MGDARMLSRWAAQVQEWLEHLHGHQVKALALAAWSMVSCGSCRLSKLAAATPTAARLPSSERRWQRLLNNKRIDVDRAADALARPWLRRGGMMNLLLDETANGDRLRVMKLSLQVRGRAVPLRWRCYRHDAVPEPMPRLVNHLLGSVDRLLPADAEVVLLTDRGLAWPTVVDFCVAHGWHFLLRVQGQTRARLEDGRVLPIDQLTPRRRSAWFGRAEVFKESGWRPMNICARWPRDGDEPWLLVTDLPPGPHLFNRYRKRMRQELAFRDEKSHGLGWHESLVCDPAHAHRLLLVMALAMIQLIVIGLGLVKRGLRRRLERPDRRTFSVFQLALRYLRHQLALDATRPP